MSGGYQGGGLPDWQGWVSIVIYAALGLAILWLFLMGLDWIGWI